MTGATGFIGRHLVDTLVREGFRLTLVVRDMGRCPSPFRDHPAIDLVRYAPVERSIDLAAALDEAAAIVHLAGLAHVSPKVGQAAFETANALATKQIVEQAARSKVPLFIHMSSIAAITGNASRQTIDDSAAPHPVTAYGASKREAEKHVATLAEEGICAISLRPPLVVGHDAKGNWARLQKLAATGLPLPFASIRNRRSAASVDLLADAIADLCRQMPDARKSGNYGIADPVPISLADLLTELRAGMGMPPRLLPFPASLFGLAGRLANRRQWVASLTDDLVIDPARFFSTFSIRPSSDLRAAIRHSGAQFRRARQDHPPSSGSGQEA